MKKQQSKKDVVRYPWDKWFKRSKFQLTRHKDFEGMTHAMSIQVRNAAAKRGLLVQVDILENGLNVLVVGKRPCPK